MKLFLTFLLSCLFLRSGVAQLTETQRFISEADNPDGADLAMSDTWLVVGNNDGFDVYAKDDETDDEWVLQHSIALPTNIGISYHYFGQSLALAGDTIAVRVREAQNYNAYHLLLFGWNGSEWVYTETLPLGSARFVILTESLLVFTEGTMGDLHIFTHSGPGQIDTTSEQIIEGEFRIRPVVKDEFIFAASYTGNLHVFERNDEGLYTEQSVFDDATYFPTNAARSGGVFAVMITEFDTGQSYLRVYAIEKGEFILQESIPVDGLYLTTFIFATEGLLLISYDDFDTGAHFELYGLGAGPYSGLRERYYASYAGITADTSESAASIGTVAVSWSSFNDDFSVVQLFSVLPPTRIRKFVLFGTDKDKRVSPSLEDGDVYDRKEIGRALNIKAVTDGSVESVVFELNGSEYSIDDGFPYMLRDGDPKDHRRVPELASGGTFTLTATPYSGPGGTGSSGSSSTITFTLT